MTLPKHERFGEWSCTTLDSPRIIAYEGGFRATIFCVNGDTNQTIRTLINFKFSEDDLNNMRTELKSYLDKTWGEK
jgi:hypothetical protein